MVDDSIAAIRGWLSLPRSQKAVLAQEAGLSPNTLTGVENDDWNPRAATLRSLEAAVGRLKARGSSTGHPGV